MSEEKKFVILGEFQDYLNSKQKNFPIQDQTMMKTFIPAIIISNLDESEISENPEDTRGYMEYLSSYMMGYSDLPMIEMSGSPIYLWVHKAKKPIRGAHCFYRMWGRGLPKVIDNTISEKTLDKLLSNPGPDNEMNQVPFQSLIEGEIYEIDELKHMIEVKRLNERKREIQKETEIVMCGNRGSTMYYINSKEGKPIKKLCPVRKGSIKCDCTIDTIFEGVNFRKMDIKELADYVMKFEMKHYGIDKIDEEMKKKVMKEFMNSHELQVFVLKNPGEIISIERKDEEGYESLYS